MKKMRRAAALFLVLCLILGGCGGGGGETESTTAAGNQAEETTAAVNDNRDATGTYLLASNGEAVVDDENLLGAVPAEDNNRVFYEIFVGSFSDSNGDGIGDLQGIIQRMDYLNDGDDDSGLSLGVEGIWLTPIFQSKSYHKYDVDDYYKIDPSFGTEDDLTQLITLCHDRGVKLILDLVLNHTGLNHPWFTAFREAHVNGDKDDPYYDYYTYVPSKEDIPAGRTFAQLVGTSEYYECNFSTAMPELNYDNEAVRQAVLDIANYYLDLGVDGFRFDAAKYIYFDEHEKSGAFWDWFLAALREKKPDIYTVAEVWDSDGITDYYYPATNCFDFTMAQSSGMIAEAAKAGDVNRFVNYVDLYLDRVSKMRDGAAIVPFIANHDTDRAAGFLSETNGQMKMAANLLLLSPGSPFVYYGEELGEKGSRGDASTDANRRLKMEWGDGDTVQDPEGTDYEHTRVSATAVEQMADGNSLYTYYKKLIMIRKAYPAIASGEYTALSFEDTKAGGFVSEMDGEKVAVIHNTTTGEVTLDLSAAGIDSPELKVFIGLGTATLDGTSLTLGEKTSAVLKVQ